MENIEFTTQFATNSQTSNTTMRNRDQDADTLIMFQISIVYSFCDNTNWDCFKFFMFLHFLKIWTSQECHGNSFNILGHCRQCGFNLGAIHGQQ